MTKLFNECHESEKLNRLLGKKVLVVFFDGEIRKGVLEKSKHSARYKVDNVAFYKSHVRQIKEAKA